MKKTKNKKQSRRTTKLTFKLALLVFIIIAAAEVLSFTATIVIGYVGGGVNDTTEITVSVVASMIIGGLLAIIIGNFVLHPLNELIRAAKKVSEGDYSVRVEMGWNEKHTVNELNQFISIFNAMSEELSHTEMFRKDFIANFSHEFKTPLASIRGFARQLHEGDLTEEQRREFSRIIMDEAEYLSVLASNTLLLTNMENRSIVTDKTEFSLDEQLRSCMLHLEPQWSEKELDIDMDMDEVSYFWNEQLLSHVWHNLLDNAVKFTPHGGSIRVSCREESGVVTVTIADSGIGMSEEALHHIFEKFYQADKSHATKGNGLGLPLVKRIVNLCGGDISARSKPNEGTEFTVRLKATK